MTGPGSSSLNWDVEAALAFLPGRRLPAVGCVEARKWQRGTSGGTSGERPGGFGGRAELRKRHESCGVSAF